MYHERVHIKHKQTKEASLCADDTLSNFALVDYMLCSKFAQF